jgi:hypothetical protein
MNFLGVVVECYGLDMKCSPQKAHVLKSWSPTGSIILGGPGNFSRRGWAGGHRSLEVCPWVSTLISLSLLPGCHEVHSLLLHMPCLPRWTEPWDKISLSSLKLFMLGILSQWQRPDKINLDDELAVQTLQLEVEWPWWLSSLSEHVFSFINPQAWSGLGGMCVGPKQWGLGLGFQAGYNYYGVSVVWIPLQNPCWNLIIIVTVIILCVASEEEIAGPLHLQCLTAGADTGQRWDPQDTGRSSLSLWLIHALTNGLGCWVRSGLLIKECIPCCFSVSCACWLFYHVMMQCEALTRPQCHALRLPGLQNWEPKKLVLFIIYPVSGILLHLQETDCDRSD